MALTPAPAECCWLCLGLHLCPVLLDISTWTSHKHLSSSDPNGSHHPPLPLPQISPLAYASHLAEQRPSTSCLSQQAGLHLSSSASSLARLKSFNQLLNPVDSIS